MPLGPHAVERASDAELKPHKLEGTMAFMVETRFPRMVTAFAAGCARLQADHPADGRSIQKPFGLGRP